MPGRRHNPSATGQAAVTTSRCPVREAKIVGLPHKLFQLSAGAKQTLAPPSSAGMALNGCSAASLRRPISRMVGRWWAGSASISLWLGRCPSSRAQRAPGRHPPPRGTEQAPGLSSMGAAKRGASDVAASGRLTGRSSCARRSTRRSRSIASWGR